MNRSNRGSTISRREATGMLAAVVTLAAGTVLAGSSVSAAAVPRVMRPANEALSERGLANMTRDLASLAAEHFEPLVGETFTIGEYEVTLRDVRRMKVRSRFREQFSKPV